MGREVMAIPGSIHAPQSRGAHALIKQGAALIETAQDVLDALGWAGHAASPGLPGTAAQALEHTGDPLLDALGHDPVALDALAARTGMAPSDLGARLLMLELEGQVARLPGQLFQRSARA
jgi:DNA processing protein